MSKQYQNDSLSFNQKRAKELGLLSQRFTDYTTLSESAIEKLQKIKKKDRTYLSALDWSKSRYADSQICEDLLKNCPQEIDTIDYGSVTVEDFAQRYLKPKIPVLISGMYSQDYIDKNWSFQKLYEKYKDAEFKCGEDDDGHKLKIKLKYYLEYLIHNKDDSPLYLFESSLEDNKEARGMIQKYQIPKYFTDDFFQYTGDKKRPPYRWFLLGPKRSGTTVHQDPLQTDAWNTSFQGYKRWVCFPEEIPKAIVKGRQYYPPDEDNEAINYFAKVLPQIIKMEGRENLKIIEFIQGPGQTVYVPGGMWHAVLNVSDTIAVTQNTCHSYNLDLVWRSIRTERKKFACYLLKKLEKYQPQIGQRCKQINKDDKFVMFDEEQQILKRRKQSTELNQKEITALEIIKKKKKYSVDSSGKSSSSSSSSSDYSPRSQIDITQFSFSPQRNLSPSKFNELEEY